MIQGIGAPELGILALLLFFFIGGRKLPELSRGIGESFRELKKAAKEEV